MNLLTKLQSTAASLILLGFLISVAASAESQQPSSTFLPGRYVGYSNAWNYPLSADLRVRRSRIVHLDANIPVVCRDKQTDQVHSFSLNVTNQEFAQALPFQVDSQGNFWGELWINEQEHGLEQWVRMQLRVTGRFRRARNRSRIFFDLDYETDLEVCDRDTLGLRLNHNPRR